MHEFPQALPLSQTLQHSEDGMHVPRAFPDLDTVDAPSITTKAASFIIYACSHEAGSPSTLWR
jgi:hypothetical protein